MFVILSSKKLGLLYIVLHRIEGCVIKLRTYTLLFPILHHITSRRVPGSNHPMTCMYYDPTMNSHSMQHIITTNLDIT